MAHPQPQPKAMSSRLATMKFMQRAAASPANSEPPTPAEPPSKKARLSDGRSAATTPASTPRELRTPGEEKQAAAVEAESRRRGESKWYLSLQAPQPQQNTGRVLKVVQAGYSMLDAPENERQVRLEGGEEEKEEDGIGLRQVVAGRRSFGKFNRMIEKQQNPDLSSSDSDDSSADDDDDADEEEDEDDTDDPTGANALIAQSRREAGGKARADRKAKRAADKAEASRLADERRKKQVKLNRLSGISANSGVGGSPAGNVTCHQCGQKGHVKRDCPEGQQRGTRRRRD